MAAPAGPFKLHPAALAGANATGIQTIPLTLGSDVDFTAPAGQTGGYCARAILIGSTAGNLSFYDATGAGPYTQAVAANQRFDQMVSYIVNSGTTAATVSAIL